MGIQALPEFQRPRKTGPAAQLKAWLASIMPSPVLNVRRGIHIDSGWTESIRNVLGNGRLRGVIMGTQMISLSVTGKSCSHALHTTRREERRGDNRDQALPVSTGQSPWRFISKENHCRFHHPPQTYLFIVCLTI